MDSEGSGRLSLCSRAFVLHLSNFLKLNLLSGSRQLSTACGSPVTLLFPKPFRALEAR